MAEPAGLPGGLQLFSGRRSLPYVARSVRVAAGVQRFVRTASAVAVRKGALGQGFGTVPVNARGWIGSLGVLAIAVVTVQLVPPESSDRLDLGVVDPLPLAPGSPYAMGP